MLSKGLRKKVVTTHKRGFASNGCLCKYGDFKGPQIPWVSVYLAFFQRVELRGVTILIHTQIVRVAGCTSQCSRVHLQDVILWFWIELSRFGVVGQVHHMLAC